MSTHNIRFRGKIKKIFVSTSYLELCVKPVFGMMLNSAV